MQISYQNQKLQAVASEDETRYNIIGVHFNCTHCFATDGHKAVIAKKAKDEPENVTIRFEGKKRKAKDATKPSEFVGAHGKFVDQFGTVATKIEGEFPDVNQCIPRETSGIVVGFNARYILELAKALESDGDTDCPVYLELPKPDERGEYRGAFLVSGKRNDAIGILMPLRTDKVEAPLARLNRIKKEEA